MKTPGTTLERTIDWWVRYTSLKILFRGVRLCVDHGVSLTLDNSDMSRGGPWRVVSF
jgi:diadenosine tetraphosphatase ApaH/serine/threonine PP2A family protein phosphatase